MQGARMREEWGRRGKGAEGEHDGAVFSGWFDSRVGWGGRGGRSGWAGAGGGGGASKVLDVEGVEARKVAIEKHKFARGRKKLGEHLESRWGGTGTVEGTGMGLMGVLYKVERIRMHSDHRLHLLPSL